MPDRLLNAYTRDSIVITASSPFQFTDPLSKMNEIRVWRQSLETNVGELPKSAWSDGNSQRVHVCFLATSHSF
jgi:hypothetical protein